MLEKKKKNYTPNEAKLKIEIFCNYQERCHKEVRDKLYTFGLIAQDIEEIMVYVVQKGMINEERFAKAFAGGKFRQKKWGKNKIIRELKNKQISTYCIEKAMKEIDPNDYANNIQRIADKYFKNIKTGTLFEKKLKTVKYLLGRGYGYEECQSIMKIEFEN